MERQPEKRTIQDLWHEFRRIEFPEYQREPTVWSREQKQRLLDSIMRQFDIAAIYFYVRQEDGVWECIDGRQRLNAIMSFLNDNPADEDDQGFSLRITNEVADDPGDPLRRLEGKTFEDLDPPDRDAVLRYEVTTVFLRGFRSPEEFNLQFLRLNLGTLINAGEKLHAMVGVMRDRIFDEETGLGQHPFLASVRVPTRRYAHQLIAAQLMLQVSARSADPPDFARARHFDLQRYLKEYSDREDPNLEEVKETLDALQEKAPDLGAKLANRAIAVSVALAAWELRVRDNAALAEQYGEFVMEFLERLKYQAERLKEFRPDPRYPYLTDFQRHLTQAAVERPAVRYRHEQLIEQFEHWRATGGQLAGDELPAPPDIDED
jgi:hypothetical protein